MCSSGTSTSATLAMTCSQRPTPRNGFGAPKKLVAALPTETVAQSRRKRYNMVGNLDQSPSDSVLHLIQRAKAKSRAKAFRQAGERGTARSGAA